MANVLRNRGVGKGDRVTLYMPMIPEAAYAMLACARLGAIHAIVFGGFSPDSLASRIQGCASKVVITADEGLRGGRKVPLKANVDEAIKRIGTDLVDHVDRRAPHRRQRRHGGRPRRLLRRGRRAGDRRVPRRARGGRAPAVHPLHLGLDRAAEGRGAHHGRLPRLRLDDARVRLRLPRGRRLLVHRRCRLGHRPQLHRLRPARERRDHADVRGHPDLPVERPGSGR